MIDKEDAVVMNNDASGIYALRDTYEREVFFPLH